MKRINYNKYYQIIKSSRPKAIHLYDQFFMKKHGMIRQSKIAYKMFEGKKVLFLGDGDGALSFYELLYNDGYYRKSDYVYLLDFDKRILDYHIKIHDSIQSKINLKTILYNVLDEPPKIDRCDIFYINPPYDFHHHGIIINRWIDVCIDLCKDDALGIIIMPTDYKYNINYNYYGLDNVKKHLENNGFKIVKIYHNIHEYYNEFQPRLKSSTIIVERRNNKRKYAEKVPKRYSFVYEKEVDLPHYINNGEFKRVDPNE